MSAETSTCSSRSVFRHQGLVKQSEVLVCHTTAREVDPQVQGPRCTHTAPATFNCALLPLYDVMHFTNCVLLSLADVLHLSNNVLLLFYGVLLFTTCVL